MMNRSNASLQTLLGIEDSATYKEFNIVLLLNKKKNEAKYPKNMEIYGNHIDISENLTGDFACLIFTNFSCSGDILNHNLQAEQVYSKRFSGVLNALKMYLEYHKIYAKKVMLQTKKESYKDDRGLYCCFSNPDISINVICYGDDGEKMDASSIQMLDQLIYIAQVKSGQLKTVHFTEDGIAEWSSKKKTEAVEELKKLRENYEQGLYHKANYDMLNSKEYYFDFEEKDSALPAGFEKHMIITGSAREMVIFSRLTHLCKQIQRDTETLVGK